jgi:peptidoglycan/LPS O-acetylase OafA/YrhL
LKTSAALSPRVLTPAASAHLDLIRALAAWTVMWGHLRALFFVDFLQVQHHGPLLKILYFVTGFGNEAVLVFFVLSGFLISSAIIGRRVSGAWSWRDYAIDRASRLYTVLIPGLLFGFLWDKLGSKIFASTAIYSHPLDSFAASVVQAQLGVGTFFGSLFFLQTVVCPTFGSNTPLWSLANEFWYYVLFPVAVAAAIAWKQRSIICAIALTILTLAVAVFVGWHILAGFLIWLAGTALVILYSQCPWTSKSRLILYVVASSTLLSACLLAARTGKPTAFGNNTTVGLAFALFLFGILQMTFGSSSRMYPRAAHVLAGFSYSLYVLHFPLLLFLRAWIVPPQRWQPDAAHLARGAAIGLATIAYAWFVSLFTENKTQVVRQGMKALVPILDSRSR